jgi:hypothetical protein
VHYLPSLATSASGARRLSIADLRCPVTCNLADCVLIAFRVLAILVNLMEIGIFLSR